MAQEYLNALPKGTRLHEYEIIRVLGAGGFGLTYLAFDNNLDKAVAIKEYLPNDLAVRTGDSEVRPKATDCVEDFEWGLDKFLKEAKTLAKFDHPNIIRVTRFFEANNTGYIVMDYAEGETLAARIEAKGTLPVEELKPIIFAIASGLEKTHAAGILHRDIKPGNIIILDTGTPVLIDFGAARHAMGSKSESIAAIVTPGYSPIEQYDTDGNQGVWTDIHALAAVGYTALVGTRPPDAPKRLKEDPMEPAVKAAEGKAGQHFLAAIDWGLMPFEDQRPQKLEEWLSALRGEKTIPIKKGHSQEAPVEERISSVPPSAPIVSQGGRNVPAILIALAGVISVGVIAYLYASGMFLSDPNGQQAGTVPVETTTTVASQPSLAETEAWTRAQGLSSIAGFQAYLDLYPNGHYVSEANEAILVLRGEQTALDDDAAWAQALALNTIEGFIDYIAQFPDGRHLIEARNYLETLSRDDSQAGDYQATSNVNIREWPSTRAQQLGSLTANAAISVQGKVYGRDWYAIGMQNGSKAYIHTSLARARESGQSGAMNIVSSGGQGSMDTGSSTASNAINNPHAANLSRSEIKRRWLDAIRRRNN